MNRKAPVLIVLLLAAGAALFLLLGQGDDGPRSGRSNVEQEGGGDPGTGDRTPDDESPGEEVATKEQLQELIEKHGGFRSKGRVVLTRPKAPGADLAVRLSGTVDGIPVEARAKTDGEGAFALDELPRSNGFQLTIEGQRVQTLSVDVPLPETDAHDFGELILKRYYFISGRVVAAGGTSVPDAEVAVITPAGGGRSFSFMQMAKESRAEDPVLVSGRSDNLGGFQLRLTEPGIFTVRTRAKGFASNYRGDVVVRAAEDDAVTIVLAEGHEVDGYVLDQSGRPVPGVPVGVWRIDFRDFSFPKELTKTDGAGKFSLRMEPTTTNYYLSVMPLKGIERTVQFEVPLNEPLIVEVPTTGTIVARVEDGATQVPLAGAEVLVSFGPNRGGGMMGRMPPMSKMLRTDSTGTVRVGGVAGQYVLSLIVKAKGYADFRAFMFGETDKKVSDAILATKVADLGETKLPTIPMKRGRVLSGIVTDKNNESPIPGARVQLWDFVTGNREIAADAEGRYRFDGVGDRVAMIVQAQGYGDFRDRPFPGFALPGQDPEVSRDITLERGATVSGVVKTVDGKPVHNALVRLRPAGGGRGRWMSSMSLRDHWTQTDRRGRYRIEGVPPLKIRAEVEAQGFDRARSADQDLAPGATVQDLDVKVVAAAKLEGVIVDQAGDPVASARIVAAKDPGKDADVGRQWRALTGGVQAFSDKRGRFVLEGVPVGDVLLRVEARGFATATMRFKASAGEAVPTKRVTLNPAFSISGSVLDEDGAPVTNCWVRARQTSSPDGTPTTQLLSTRVEPNGSFRFEDLPAGTYRIEARFWGGFGGTRRYQNQEVDGVSAGAEGLEIVAKAAPPPEERPRPEGG